MDGQAVPPLLTAPSRAVSAPITAPFPGLSLPGHPFRLDSRALSTPQSVAQHVM